MTYRFESFFTLGIDPGQNGGVAFFNFETRVLDSVHPMPLNPDKSVDVYALALLIETKAVLVRLAVIEKVSSMPGQGVASTFKFGFHYGIVFGVVAAHRIPIVDVVPSVWKSKLNLSHDKKKSLAMASNHFPEHEKEFRRNKDDGKAEAALLAEYGAKLL